MKKNYHHVIVQKDLRCRFRNFELDQGALIFLNDASKPMIEWLQDIYINDTEALFGDTDTLMKIPTLLTSPKVAKQNAKRQKRIKKQLYERVRSKPND